MGEKLQSTSLEHGDHNPEALSEAGAERRAELHEQREQSIEQRAGDERLEDLERLAKANAEKVTKNTELVNDKEKQARGPVSRSERDASFSATMIQTRQHMNLPSRNFSKVIHSKPVEKISDLGAKTIARPNAILSGAVVAFFVTLAVYLVAKRLGYPLSGFESIGAFILGWILGIMYDFLKVMITGKK